MITAAVVSSRLVPRIRPVGRSSVSPVAPRTCGITGSPCDSTRAELQPGTSDGWLATSQSNTTMAAALRAR